MTKPTQSRASVRAINTAFAVALAVFVLGNDWPIVKVFDLARADLQYQGVLIEGHAKRIIAVTLGRVADRAGLKTGDTGAGDWSARPRVGFERRIVLCAGGLPVALRVQPRRTPLVAGILTQPRWAARRGE